MKLFLRINAVLLLFATSLLAMESDEEENGEARKAAPRQHREFKSRAKKNQKAEVRSETHKMRREARDMASDTRREAIRKKAAAAKAAVAPVLGENQRRLLFILGNNLQGFKEYLGEFEPTTEDLADQKPRAETLVRDMFSRNNLSPQAQAAVETAKKKFDEAFAQLPEIQAFQAHMQKYFHIQFERLRKAPTDPLDSENWAMIRSTQEDWMGICTAQETRQKNDYVASLKISQAFINLLRAINPDMETWARSDLEDMRAVDQLLAAFYKETQGGEKSREERNP